MSQPDDPFDQFVDQLNRVYNPRRLFPHRQGEPVTSKNTPRSVLAPLVLFGGLAVAVGLTAWPVAVQVSLWSGLAFLGLAVVTGSRGKTD